MAKMAICFYLQYKWFTPTFYHVWIDFYSINDDCSKKMQVHSLSTFIFFMVTADSHVLEKDVVKKKIKNDGKADTESKIVIKKDAIQHSNESIRPYEDEQKSLQEKLKKLNEKEQDLVMKLKNTC